MAEMDQSLRKAGDVDPVHRCACGHLLTQHGITSGGPEDYVRVGCWWCQCGRDEAAA